MSKYKIVKKDLGNICRKCLNEKYSLNLMSKDCIYDFYPRLCGECGCMKNIVRSIRFIKRLFI